MRLGWKRQKGHRHGDFICQGGERILLWKCNGAFKPLTFGPRVFLLCDFSSFSARLQEPLHAVYIVVDRSQTCGFTASERCQKGGGVSAGRTYVQKGACQKGGSLGIVKMGVELGLREVRQ